MSGARQIAAKMICLASASLLNTNIATADSIGLRFAQTFMGTCVHDFPDVSKLKAASKTFGWKEITDPNVKALMGPSDPSLSWQGWYMVVNSDKYFVGISDGVSEGKTFHTCSLVQDKVDVKATISELVKLLNANKLDETVEAGQRYGTWEFKNNGSSLLLMTTDGTPMNYDLINASVTTDFRSK